MYLKVLINVFLFFFILLISNNSAFADPEVYISQNNVTSGSNYVDIPINISGVSGANIAGYILRLDYDDSELSNPSLILSNTLSQGLNVEGVVPVDGFGGKYSIGLMSGFNASNDGILVKVRLNVSNEFESSDISFISAKTQLHSADYSPINANFTDGSLTKIDIIIGGSNVSAIPTLNEYGIMLFISILMLSSLLLMKKKIGQNL